MTTDPWRYWSAETIAAATACPLENVLEHWPRINEQLDHCELPSPNVHIGVMGTLAIEGASTFEPVREGCYLGEPEPAQTHRNGLPYAPYWGRGHIQLTHEGNYDLYGQKVADLWVASPDDPSFDLITTPDNALEPNIAAAVIALWFRDTRALPSPSYPEGYTLVEACEAQDWEWVRILVYGGSDPAGQQRLAQIAADLGPPGGVPVTPPVVILPVYDPAYPAISQNDSWSCAPTSMRWALYAYGRTPTEQWLEGSMLSEGVVSVDAGLLDASGAGLAAWATRHYGPEGYHGEHDPSLTFDEAAHEALAQKHPCCIGGRGWYHWSGLRGYAGGKLLLANPASGWKGITQTMSREQFEYLGPFSLVRLVHAAAEAGGEPVPIPPDPGDAYAPWHGKVGSGLLQMMQADGVLPAQRSSTWLPLGVTPADVETCVGQNGTYYYWLLSTNVGYRQAAA